jgi:hypothetical protein
MRLGAGRPHPQIFGNSENQFPKFFLAITFLQKSPRSRKRKKISAAKLERTPRHQLNYHLPNPRTCFPSFFQRMLLTKVKHPQSQGGTNREDLVGDYHLAGN